MPSYELMVWTTKRSAGPDFVEVILEERAPGLAALGTWPPPAIAPNRPIADHEPQLRALIGFAVAVGGDAKPGGRPLRRGGWTWGFALEPGHSHTQHGHPEDAGQVATIVIAG